MRQLLIDTDPGHDDAVALLLASRWADVVGITTVSGNAPLAATTRNALAIVELIGAETPVVAGAAQPLAGPPRHAPQVHGASGLDGVELPEPSRSPAGSDAVAFILDMARACSGMWILAIGPLTNIAQAISADPGLARRVAGIAIMGGSTRVGNVTPVAEFNIWADPEAARVVLRSGARIRLCGLNLTHQLQIDDRVVERLEAAGRASVPGPARCVSQAYRYLLGRMEALTGARRAALHDPCALLALTHPHLLRFEPRVVDVELAGSLTRGMTVVDERPGRRPEGAPVDVGYTIQAEAALALIVDTLLDPHPAAPDAPEVNR